MVVPMKKYSFLVYHNDYLKFLENLSSLGVLHVIEKKSKSADSETLDNLEVSIVRFMKAIHFLKSRKQPVVKSDTKLNGLKILEELNSNQLEYEKLNQELVSVKKEISILTPWGDFSPETINSLAESGITVRFYSVSAKKFSKDWLEKHNVEIINKVGTAVYFAFFQKGNQEAEFVNAEEIKMPNRSLKDAKKLENDIEGKLQALDKIFDENASKNIQILQVSMNSLILDVDFERVKICGEKQVEDRLIILQGWVPVKREEELVRTLNEEDVVFFEEAPDKDEVPPVMLKNGFFSKLFEPIGKLFSLPNYAELDLTAAFAPFFTLFFGLCLGDAGYGLVIFLLTFIARFKVKKELKPIMTLAMILGFSTMVIGTLTGTVFGVWLAQTGPEAIKSKILIPDSGTIFYMALGIGVVQILFGMVVQCINRIKQSGFMGGLSTIGWIIMILSLLVIMLGGSIDFLKQILPVANITVFVGIGLILFFNDIKANIFVRLGKGIWELYNITGFFGDVLSYVRLFALGISSAILGLVINNIGGQLKDIPIAGPVLFVLFLIIGHSGNILLSGLGSFVHPMRLTFVEFYNNAGFTGGGKEYKPFIYRKKK